MTFQRFKQLWLSIIGKHPVIDPKIVCSGCSPHTTKALIKVADGDHSEFDKIGELLDRHDATSAKILDEKCEVLSGLKTTTPRETRKYFRNRFGQFVPKK